MMAALAWACVAISLSAGYVLARRLGRAPRRPPTGLRRRQLEREAAESEGITWRR